jgi:phosphopantothenoylcysteine decarboxylase/phosphopantothenate--cysteine ligase
MDDRGVEIMGDHLSGKQILYIVCGGIGAIEAPRVVRELRRYGANVKVAMTSSASEFVQPLAFEWASAQGVVTQLSGQAEHISKADAVIVAPATLDFIGKAAAGFADSSAMTLLQSQLGKVPVLFFPTMHKSMEENPLYQQNLPRLKKVKGVSFHSGRGGEGKAKMPQPEDAVRLICHLLSQSPLAGQHAVVTLGPTRSLIDDVRFVSNHSTGRLGVQIVDELYRSGMSIDALCGPISVPRFEGPRWTDVITHADMQKALKKSLQPQTRTAIFAAAVLDYGVVRGRKGKTSSAQTLEVQLKPEPKLISLVPSLVKGRRLVKVGFKLESGVTTKSLLQLAKKALVDQSSDLVIANRLEDVGATHHRAYLVTTRQVKELNGVHEIARSIRLELERK